MNQMSIFDAELSEKGKREGMAQAEDNSTWLEKARELARDWGAAAVDNKMTADDVMVLMEIKYGIDSLGPAAGSLFKTKEWEWTGEFIKSTRITNHSRLLRVWKLRA